MADLVAADAAFEGFRIPREKPRVVLVWALLHLVMGVFMTAVMISVGGDAMARFVTLSQERNPDPAATMAAFQQLAPVYAALLPPGLLVQSVFSAAIYRVILRPADSSLAYLRLGPDELRIALLNAPGRRKIDVSGFYRSIVAEFRSIRPSSKRV